MSNVKTVKFDELNSRMRMRISIDEVVGYDQNPRQSKNPNYYEIKESIRVRGLDHAPNITKRNSNEPFMIKDGGNTRLQILRELWTETQDERFYYFEADFIPWVSELDTLAGHMVENESRGDTLFIERAFAAKKMRELIENERQTQLSIRDLAIEISATGWRVQAGSLTRYEYATNVLINLIPKVLWSGAGHDLITKIRKINKAYFSLWKCINTHENNFLEILWDNTLKAHDTDTRIDLDSIRSTLNKAIANQTDIKIQVIGSNTDALMNGADTNTLLLNIDDSNSSLQDVTEIETKRTLSASAQEYALDINNLQSELFEKAKALAERYGFDELVQWELPERGRGYGFVVSCPKSPFKHNSDAAHIWWHLFSLSCHPFTYQGDELSSEVQEDVANRVFGSFASYTSVISSTSFFITRPDNQATEVGNRVREIEQLVAKIRLLMAKQ